jgi:hypothetical protein
VSPRTEFQKAEITKILMRMQMIFIPICIQEQDPVLTDRQSRQGHRRSAVPNRLISNVNAVGTLFAHLARSAPRDARHIITHARCPRRAGLENNDFEGHAKAAARATDQCLCDIGGYYREASPLR